MLSVPVRPSPATMTRIPSTLGANKSMKSKWCLNAMAVTPEQGRVWSKLKGATLSLKSGHPHNTWRIDSFLPGLGTSKQIAATNGCKFPEILITMKLRYFVGSFCQGGYPSGGIGRISGKLRLKTSDLRISAFFTSLAISMPNSTPDQGSNS